jgi:hypothetical protein
VPSSSAASDCVNATRKAFVPAYAARTGKFGSRSGPLKASSEARGQGSDRNALGASAHRATFASHQCTSVAR